MGFLISFIVHSFYENGPVNGWHRRGVLGSGTSCDLLQADEAGRIHSARAGIILEIAAATKTGFAQAMIAVIAQNPPEAYLRIMSNVESNDIASGMENTVFFKRFALGSMA